MANPICRMLDAHFVFLALTRAWVVAELRMAARIARAAVVTRISMSVKPRSG